MTLQPTVTLEPSATQEPGLAPPKRVVVPPDELADRGEVEFDHRTRTPPTPVGRRFVFLVKGSIRGTIGGSRPRGLAVESSQVALAWERRLLESWSAYATGRLENTRWTDVVKAVRQGTWADLQRLFAGTEELGWRPAEAYAEMARSLDAGVDLSLTPFVVRHHELTSIVVHVPEPVTISGVEDVGVWFGLTPEGWRDAVRVVTPRTLRRFFHEGAGGAAVTFTALAETGVLMAAGTALTSSLAGHGFSALAAALSDRGTERRQVHEIACRYAAGYVERVYGSRQTSTEAGVLDHGLVAELVEAGRRDAVSDARVCLQRLRAPILEETAEDALAQYRELLDRLHGDEAAAAKALRESFELRVGELVAP